MTEKQIKSKRKILEKQIAKREGIYERATSTMNKSRQEWNKACEKLYKLRRNCKHKFPNKKPTYMGKGICEICGENDY